MLLLICYFKCLLFFIENACALSSDKYLTHFWPIINCQMTDIVGSSDMIQGNMTEFIGDRFNQTNSALNLNGGWTQVPNGIYFNSPEFTISAWVYPKQVGLWARLMDFGNGQQEDNIFITLDSGTGGGSTDGRSTFSIWIGTWAQLMSPWPGMAQNKWQMLTATFNGTTMSLYVNGNLVSSGSNPMIMNNLNRTNCYFGKSNLGSNDGFSSSYLDEIRFYNKSFTQEEIIELMNQNETTAG